MVKTSGPWHDRHDDLTEPGPPPWWWRWVAALLRPVRLVLRLLDPVTSRMARVPFIAPALVAVAAGRALVDGQWPFAVIAAGSTVCLVVTERAWRRSPPPRDLVR